MKKYCFVDFAAHYQKGFRNHIVKIQEIPGWIEKYKAYECFSTYFFYTDEIFAYMTAHAFPYRYGCHDMIAQKFCSLGDYRRCQEWTKSRKSKKEIDETPTFL